MTQRFIVDQIITGDDARVIIWRSPAGNLLEARFDLSGLPRVDALMVGRPVAEVPALVERLCGVCPVAHHLAGVQALEALWGPVQLTPTARLIRQLLNFGAVIDAHIPGFLRTDLPSVMVLRRFAKSAMAAAGSPKHFPTTAVPGGVARPVAPAELAALSAQVNEALAAAEQLVAATDSGGGPAWCDAGVTADVALVDEAGRPDFLGRQLRAVGVDGAVLVDGARPEQWGEVIHQARPGEAAPRPYLAALGPQRGVYRTGPVAQLFTGPLGTPQAAAAQERWGITNQRAGAARAIIVLYCVESIADLIRQPELLLDDVGEPLAPRPVAGTGVGWAETGRGLLIHEYTSSADGTMTAATILTPTAQNEPWLAELLGQAVRHPEGDLALALEDAIREADPCLPCATAAPGEMGLVIEDETVYPGDQGEQTEGA